MIGPDPTPYLRAYLLTLMALWVALLVCAGFGWLMSHLVG